MATEIWSWQNGTVDDDTLDAIAVGADGSVFLAGDTRGSWGREGSGDGTTAQAIAVKLDSEGTEVFRWQDDWVSNVAFSASAAAIGPDGLGYVGGTAYTQGEGDSLISTVFHLDSDGSLLWKWTVDEGADDDVYAYDDDGGTHEDAWFMQLTGLASVGDDSGDIYVVGFFSEGSFQAAVAYRLSSASREIAWKWQAGITRSSRQLRGVESVDNGQAVVVVGESSYSPLAVKLASNGTKLWEWHPESFGVSNRYDSALGESCSAVAAAGNSSVVIACSTHSDFGGHWAGSWDFAAVMLDLTNGNEIWRWQGGTNAEDMAKAVTVVEGGLIVLAGYTKGDWAISNLGSVDFAAVSLSLDGEEISRFQDGSFYGDIFKAVALSSNDSVVFAGFTGGSWNRTNLGSQDFVAVKTLDVFSTSPPETSDGELLSPQATSVLLVVLAIFVAVMVVICLVTRRSAAKRNADNASRSDSPAVGRSCHAERNSRSRYQGQHVAGHGSMPEVDNRVVNSPPVAIPVSGAGLGYCRATRAQRRLLQAGIVGRSPPVAVPVNGAGLGSNHTVGAQRSLPETGRAGGSPPPVASPANGGDVGHSHATRAQRSLPASGIVRGSPPTAV
ncbi:unnamed protein product, partial [Ectocarpus sp. 13 AM-2016]